MIRLKNIHKYFSDHHVLKGVDLTVEKGKVIAILGPSGSGKSTLLRSINFLERPSQGTIEIGDLKVEAETATAKDIFMLRSATAMVFQQFNLFKNLNALQNVMIGMTSVKHVDKQTAEKVSVGLLEKVGLGDRLKYYPSQLSGGQQQRVAIARALALNPEVLLFDEPTSALDPELVEEVLATIKQVAKEGNTILLVTHEIGFALDVADRVVLIDNGLIVEENTPKKFFYQPKEERTRQFLGNAMKRFVVAPAKERIELHA